MVIEYAVKVHPANPYVEIPEEDEYLRINTDPAITYRRLQAFPAGAASLVHRRDGGDWEPVNGIDQYCIGLRAARLPEGMVRMSGSRTIVVDSATPETMVTALIDNESRYINGVVYIQDDGTWTPVTFSRDLDWADIRSFARAAGWTWQIGWLPGGVWGVWRAPTNDGHSEARVTFRGRSEVEVSGPLPGPFCRLANPTPKAVLEVAFVAVYVAAAGGRKEWAA